MKTKFYAGSEPIKKLKQIQQQISRFYPGSFFPGNAILAGGSIRDTYFGKSDEITDYDIFIYDLAMTPEQIQHSIEQVFSSHDGIEQLFTNEYLTIEEQHDTLGEIKPGSHQQITGVWETTENDHTYQLIFTKNKPIVHVEKFFDIGLCKAYCDGTKIRYTHDFLLDAKNKTLTIVGDDMTKDQVEYAIFHHADKISWKYDGFRVVVPHRYQKFVEDCGYPTC